MSTITIYIDGQPIECEEGEYLLQVARKNNCFIPAICYLTDCSPTLACKLCMVEADGKRVYSCNAKVKKDMKVVTDTEEIATERKAIMSVYDINHPLECGVCDKSGECELQNYSLMMNVDHQEYAVKDSYKKRGHWGHALYDPNLCIVCERCVTACKDRVGDASLKTVKRDADAPDKSYKDSMPKDAFGVWNKLSKSLIGFVGEEGSCEDCGECISVCPVGALGEDHFHYASNAWELDKISSSCPHCPLGCELTYEGKHGKVYRVSNDWNANSLCGAGRYGYEITLSNTHSSKEHFNKALEAFQKAHTISFGNFITNEEAFILQMLKERHGYALYNPTALEYQNFLKNFTEVTGALYKGDSQFIKKSDCIIVLGGSIRHDIPVLKYMINNTLKTLKGSSLFVFHPVKDLALLELSRNVQHFSHNIGDEEYLAFLLTQLLVHDSTMMPSIIAEFLQKDQETETGEKQNNILSYLGFDDKSIQALKEKINNAQNITLIVGSDLYHHVHSANIAKLLGLIDKTEKTNVILLPPEGNALGVALICQLDEEKEGYTIGYNKKADFMLSSLPVLDGNRDSNEYNQLTMPSLWQQFGTLTTLDKKLVPLLPAYEYEGFDLSDIASALGCTQAFKQKNVKRDIEDYTSILPQSHGYKPMDLREVLEHGGYKLDDVLPQFMFSYQEVDFSLPKKYNPNLNTDNIIVYGRDSVSQFSVWSHNSSLLRSKGGMFLSNSLLEKLQLKDGADVEIQTQEGSLRTKVFIDSTLEGDIATLSLGLFMRDEHPIFQAGSRFAQATIKAVE